ncbi:hypothetical protein CPLU01_04164 [Colletotrichum plurivorum]|uniref:DNA2/NAM7 helicase-like C-terminal domain-containing protein n=1 Tax=Colletotrichum plurivorum TaxID=2175906 RepID=A0A8H6KQ81_9PEZI|nr:hypothetical protein CPLU01_04164 [Colletotrichum plurivorum]
MREKPVIKGFGMPFANASDPELEAWVNRSGFMDRVTLLEALQQETFHLLSSLPMTLGFTRNAFFEEHLGSPFDYPFGEDHSWDYVSVVVVVPATVDSYQGQEADIVVMGTRARNPGPGFTRDPRRLCVLLTRQRCGLVIVGDIDVVGPMEKKGKAKAMKAGYLLVTLPGTSSIGLSTLSGSTITTAQSCKNGVWLCVAVTKPDEQIVQPRCLFNPSEWASKDFNLSRLFAFYVREAWQGEAWSSAVWQVSDRLPLPEHLEQEIAYNVSTRQPCSAIANLGHFMLTAFPHMTIADGLAEL